ncbi:MULTISPECIES: amino acid ABC transporter substrate-binding protein [Comamonas]|uniref:amino acid ABC transporter substrate-binding protein n=1 Tax=Comamonas TaxID=283 RepID=UPI0001DA66B6|nr:MULTISPECIES: amino acid ABC transporter substrate-binding protein [Comamonas]EFI62286.1 Extracellular ligand-binding receptor [Comamonas thiooxydans]TFF61825.1 twin-arginine translocation pathway signal protein [Comamonas sp. A23]
MTFADKRFVLKSLVAATALAGLCGQALAQEAPKSIRIGWAIAKTGVNAGGTSVTTAPNYKLWVKEINDAGGIMLKAYNKRVPIEVIEYDDRSSTEEAVRATERLITQDKVDFVLPPWGTGSNLAVGPTYEKHKYPLLAATSVTDKAPDLAKRWKHAFFFLGTGGEYAEGLVAMLEKAKKDGKINNKIAMINIADGFGVELANATRKAAKQHGFELVYDKSYPIGTQDMTPIINEAKGKGADTFVAYSYPPDTMLINEQARTLGLAPKVLFTGVGTQFPMFKGKFGAAAEGVMAPGGIDAGNPQMQAYLKRFKEVTGQESDRFASPIVYTSLQMLQQAIERVGKIDRAAVTQELKSGSFETVLGPVKLEGQMLTKLWHVGQWQNGEFNAIAPTNRAGVKPAVIPRVTP